MSENDSDLDIKFPNVDYQSNHQSLYDDLTKKSWSPFFNYTKAQVFMFAMSYGYAYNMARRPLDDKPMSLPARAFGKDMRVLMRSLAIHEESSIDVIRDNRQVLKICTEYANASIEQIYNKIKNKDHATDSEKILELMVTDVED